MTRLSIDGERLLQRLQELGEIGVSPSGKLTRLAASDEDRLGRDAFAGWARSAGLDVRVDRIGNMFAVWEDGGEPFTRSDPDGIAHRYGH